MHSCKEVKEAKGKTPTTKKRKVFEGLTIEEQKACANPDKFVRDLVEKDRVLPQRPPKEPAQQPEDEQWRPDCATSGQGYAGQGAEDI